MARRVEPRNRTGTYYLRLGARRGAGRFRRLDKVASLISVLVTEIQRCRVGGAKGTFDQAFSRVIHGADAPWLDFCDRHRNEGGEEALQAQLHEGNARLPHLATSGGCYVSIFTPPSRHRRPRGSGRSCRRSGRRRGRGSTRRSRRHLPSGRAAPFRGYRIRSRRARPSGR
ncbi:hypothetical protein D9M68_367770 [compost metagenome]